VKFSLVIDTKIVFFEKNIKTWGNFWKNQAALIKRFSNRLLFTQDQPDSREIPFTLTKQGYTPILGSL
jgi:hypothetical protein